MSSTFLIKWFDSLDSTNNEAIRNINLYDNLTVIAAVHQTAGRGQRGNCWAAAPGENLTFSVVLKFGDGIFPPFEATDQFILTKIASLSVCDLLESYGLHPRIKWPNDVYVSGKKICGMLLENSIMDKHLSRSIVGIGININQRCFPPSLVNPTSIANLTGKSYIIEDVLDAFCRLFKVRLENLEERSLEANLDRDYLDKLYQFGSMCDYVDCASGESFKGKITGVLPDGRIKISLPDGSERLFYFKEVSYVI